LAVSPAAPLQDQDRISKICTVSPMPELAAKFRRIPVEKSFPVNAFRGIPRHSAIWPKKNKWCPEEETRIGRL
jgi:hypothetical protein